MSRINFARFREKAPELKEAWAKLEQWFDAHPDADLVETRTLSRELFPIATWDLTQALLRMRDAGVMRSSYRVVDPAGAILEDDFQSTEDIPAEMPDRMNDYWFEVKERNILPVFWLSKSS